MSLERLHIPNVASNFTIKQIPGKGRGIFAALAIPRGACLMAEAPLFYIDNVQEPLSRYNKRTLNRAISDHPQFRELFSTVKPPTDESRFDTNSFEMGEFNGGKRCGIFFQASRFNHSCVPNAYFTWNPMLNNGQGLLTIYAIHDIDPDNEILVNYHIDDCYELKDARQAKLFDKYRFVCDCAACKRQPGHEFGAMSDERRERMQTLKTQMSSRNWNLNMPRGRGAKRQIIHKLIDNIRQEGLVCPVLAEALDELGWLAKDELGFAKAADSMSAAAYVRDCREIAFQIARAKLDLDVCCNGPISPVVMDALVFIRDLYD